MGTQSLSRGALLRQYPWLKVTTTVEDYVAPDYYDLLLKQYVFSGRTDLQIFSDALRQRHLGKNGNYLELGCGSGRVTKEFLNAFSHRGPKLGLVDLSPRMLSYSRQRFRKYQKLSFFQSDSVRFLEKSSEVYDFIFSLWSFSHSTHQILTQRGLRVGGAYIRSVINKMVRINMRPGSLFFLVHFDSRSPEQRILLRQWRKVFPIYNNLRRQSPSKMLLDATFKTLSRQRKISLGFRHYIGEPIEYKSLNEALEIFMNFHLESFFNASKLLPGVINELRTYLLKFKGRDGIIRVPTGCYIYEVTRL